MSTTSKLKHTTIYLDKCMLADFRRECKKHNIIQADFIRVALSRLMDDLKQSKITAHSIHAQAAEIKDKV